MEAIRHLTEVLKSQVALYSELCDLIELEKEAREEQNIANDE